ncbi:4Fe-4S binding protein [Fuchsiella alkaliacetigena]|nr:4Fe-4S binding protein [Fuchsiella alkaliacetigena]
MGCTYCIDACPIDVVDGRLEEIHEINEEDCNACGACEPECPVDAIIQKNYIEHFPQYRHLLEEDEEEVEA